MTKTKTLLAASAALTVALGLPAWSAMHFPPQPGSVSPPSMLIGAVEDNHRLILVDDDEDDGTSLTRAESDDDDEGDECDDDANCETRSGAPAPVGSVAPPQNGLFGSGAPQVQVK